MSPDPGEEEASAGAENPGDGGSGEAADAGEAAGGTCELCGGPTVELHCKIICLNCGYKRDCSDP